MLGVVLRKGDHRNRLTKPLPWKPKPTQGLLYQAGGVLKKWDLSIAHHTYLLSSRLQYKRAIERASQVLEQLCSLVHHVTHQEARHRLNLIAAIPP